MNARRVLIGRRDDAAGETARLLRAAGFVPVAAPLIDIAAPLDPAPLTAAVTRLFATGYDWVAFTSVPAVRAVLAVAADLLDAWPTRMSGDSPSELAPGTRVAAVGPGTAAALTAAGVHVALLPASGASAGALARCWPAGTGKVLLPRSDIASPVLSDTLRAKGYEVDPVIAYRTVERPLAPEVAAELGTGGFAAVVLASGSAARSLAHHPIGASTVVIAIGESTAAAATAAELTVRAIAAEPTAASVVEAVLLAVGQTRGDGSAHSTIASTLDSTADPAVDPVAPYPRSRTTAKRSTSQQE